jgi:hypothetical protein
MSVICHDVLEKLLLETPSWLFGAQIFIWLLRCPTGTRLHTVV